MTTPQSVRRFQVPFLLLATLTTAGGCALIHQIMAGDGPMVPPLYTGLTGKRVAVVCVVNSGSFGSETVGQDIARRVARHLRGKVEQIELVRPEEVADWIDQNNWDEERFVDVGRGVDADVVLAIEVNNFRLHEGPTLYRGQASIVVRVIDVPSGGEILYDYDIPEMSFPPNIGIPTTDQTEASFRRIFVQQLAYDVSKIFFEHPMAEDFALDAAAHSR